MLKKLSLSLTLVFLFLAKPAQAAVRCESQYGGGEICVKTGELQLDKEVWDKANSYFVDNLGVNSYRFTAGEEIIFKLKIKNVGDETFSTVKVKDTLPAYLELTSGDLEFEITDLEPGETEEREIKAKVVAADQLPDDKSLVCVVNSAEAWTDDDSDSDTSQVCLEKKVLGVTTLPPTGPSYSTLILAAALVSAAFGFYLLKAAKAH